MPRPHVPEANFVAAIPLDNKPFGGQDLELVLEGERQRADGRRHTNNGRETHLRRNPRSPPTF